MQLLRPVACDLTGHTTIMVALLPGIALTAFKFERHLSQEATLGTLNSSLQAITATWCQKCENNRSPQVYAYQGSMS